ncbi:Fic family protein [Neolewinella agarilytica]|uniref:Fic family protein n=1 Tax=Neolewinella agarilytica TaxID=478744 RepID=UPI0023573599|nr:Fic family protein [Neolewinella agarilytica]
MAYKPPYEVTSQMFTLVKEIIRLVGQLEGYQLLVGNVKLRRKNKIKSIVSSLAIEGNSLTEEQVTAILEGKRVMGPRQDVKEVENAIQVYDRLETIDPYSEDELLDIHKIMMSGLITDAGRYRQSGVGVVDGTKVIHVAPPAKRVPNLMGDLFDYLENYEEDIIIKSCVFHFEFEYIHPFSDGNGRMGRLWQTAILKSEYPDLAYVPIESIVHERQQGYYDALQISQHAGDSTTFIIYALESIKLALSEQLDNALSIPHDVDGRLLAFKEQVKNKPFSRKEYLSYHKTIAPATATRDLKTGVDRSLLKRSGKSSATRYQFI